MAKDTYYFSHDYNARNDEKILELRSIYGAEGYGVFWMIVETMAESECGGIKSSLIGGLSLAFGVTKENIKNIIDYCLSIELFYNEEGYIFSRRLKKHKQLRNKLSIDGKRGAESRWKNSPPISLPIGDPNAKERKGKEIKGKEIKENIFNNFPLPTHFNGLHEIKIGSIHQLLKITRQLDVSNEKIIGMWEVFKTQNLTGSKYYQNEDAVYSHFMNWIKDKKFESSISEKEVKIKLK